MAAYRRVDDKTYGHLQADCLYTGISSRLNARYRVWEAFTFLLSASTGVRLMIAKARWTVFIHG